jgi:hypothetical protein
MYSRVENELYRLRTEEKKEIKDSCWLVTDVV